jgi:Ca2+-binding RTX toxin-like protein
VAITTVPGATSSDSTTLIGSDGADLFSVTSSERIKVEGLTGNDTVTSTTAVDTYDVVGNEGNDTFNFVAIDSSKLDGGDGNDIFNLSGTASAVTISGGQGVDDVNLTAGLKTLSGLRFNLGSGSDTIDTGATTDVKSAYFGGGKDADTFTFLGDVKTSTIRGGKQDDVITLAIVEDVTVRGDNDDDSIQVTGATTSAYIGGNAGNDTINLDGLAKTSTVRGGKGNDSITYDSTASTGSAILIKGDTGKDTVTLGAANTDANHTVYGGQGADSITGDVNGTKGILVYGDDSESGEEGGKDTIDGTAGADTIYGGAGKDVIDAIGGANLVKGGAGDDSITGGNGADTVYGGAGNDTISAEAGTVFVSGDLGDDEIIVSRADATEAGLAVDTIAGGDGTDIFHISGVSNVDTAVTFGDNTFGLVSGFETLELTAADTRNAKLTVTLGAKSASLGIVKVDATNVEAASSDVMELNASTRTSSQGIHLIGSKDAQTDDSLVGSAGVDTINTGVDGSDIIDGGAGADTFILASATGNTISDLGGTETLTIKSTAATAISLTATSNFVAATGSVNESAINADITIGGTTATSIDVSNVTGGNSGFDLTGDNDAVTLTGSSRADTFKGLGSADSLTGGAGADSFIITAGLTSDVITDFSGTAGDVDLLLLDDSELLKNAASDAGLGLHSGAVSDLINVVATSVDVSGGNVVSTFLTVPGTGTADAKVDLHGNTATLINMTQASGFADSDAVETALVGANGLLAGGDGSAGAGSTTAGDAFMAQYKDSDDGKYVIAAIRFDKAVDNANIAAGDITVIDLVKVGTTALVAADINFI